MTAGTSGTTTIAILVSESRNGTCKDPGCSQVRPCKVTYSILLWDDGEPFEGGEVDIENAEVDPAVSVGDLEPEDWEDAGSYETDETGYTEDIAERTSCDKKTFMRASFGPQTVAAATFTCGDCDVAIEAGGVTSWGF